VLVVMALVTTLLTTPLLNLMGIEDKGKETADMSVIEAA
jgi:hypothetical protein